MKVSLYTSRQKELLFQAIQMLRKTLAAGDFKGVDWKDIDDYIFSELDLTVSELDEIMTNAGGGAVYYGGSAIEGFPPRAPKEEDLASFSRHNWLCIQEVESLCGKMLVVVPLGTEPYWGNILLTSADAPALEKCWNPSADSISHVKLTETDDEIRFIGFEGGAGGKEVVLYTIRKEGLKQK